MSVCLCAVASVFERYSIVETLEGTAQVLLSQDWLKVCQLVVAQCLDVSPHQPAHTIPVGPYCYATVLHRLCIHEQGKCWQYVAQHHSLLAVDLPTATWNVYSCRFHLACKTTAYVAAWVVIVQNAVTAFI